MGGESREPVGGVSQRVPFGRSCYWYSSAGKWVIHSGIVERAGFESTDRVLPWAHIGSGTLNSDMLSLLPEVVRHVVVMPGVSIRLTVLPRPMDISFVSATPDIAARVRAHSNTVEPTF